MNGNQRLALATGLTTKTKKLCNVTESQNPYELLESGVADIFDLVTPTTAELLHWWFGDVAKTTRRLNFHDGQRQAILNTIVAHEALNARDLKSLYQAAAPDALLTGGRLTEVSQSKHNHPKYCLKMATGTGKTWVLQALLIWQLLNKNAALAQGVDDARFTRHFLVVAPGLIVYDRLLDAFCGKQVDGVRDFANSDVAQYAELFIPENHRDTVFSFVRGNVCNKSEIGLKTTGNGMIAVANWHLLQEAGEEEPDAAELETPGAEIDPQAVINALLPLMPGKSAGNSLDVLDRRFARGDVLDYLAGLPELMVFNDEAHHIHDFKREGETTEVEWQKSLTRIATSKGRRFVQVDFSATPYNDVGSGKNKHKVYFPHIIVDFDLKTAMRQGLVKSLVLDRRKEIGALPLEFKAERDENGNPVLSAGQRVMLRAGLQKLRKLEVDFAHIDPSRHPKMLVVCEDTTVSPLVVKFFQDEGLRKDEVMAIDSGRKAELGEKDWAVVREHLFDVDRHAAPRIIVSVLMLREGFDVNNICVIVPLRSSQAQILLEQTIGRGLRLMWRDEDRDNGYADSKRENRERIAKGQEPNSLIDILSIVEHPAFQSFYAELMREGLAGTTGEDSDIISSIGDLVSVGLRDGYEEFDFAIPFILREAEEGLEHHALDITSLPPFSAMNLTELKTLLGKGDVFISQDLQSSTLFGDYRVDGAVMNVTGYNDFLSRLTRRIAQALSQPLPKGKKVAAHFANPYLQANTAELAGWLDSYIRMQLFNMPFDPLFDENWRVLLLQPIVDHIIKVVALALIEAEHKPQIGESEVRYRLLSEMSKLPMRESSSVLVNKCIYPRLPYPAHNGGLEKAFIEWADKDSSVQAFCKISETRHDFVRLRYVKEDGLPASYSPDFLLRTDKAVYLVETKAQGQVTSPNVQRKLKAAAAWCERINRLPEEERANLAWHYVLLGESVFFEWRDKGALLSALCDFARKRSRVMPDMQIQLETD
ncbi:DEAD/DEAH box helicase family protein [Methyloglobulus sp.]|uniref:DEAD/DEAH box helicase family protein n=1 Tax=Methyloglobulus sp. TaxID=2518622 RepID=UPI003989D8AF